MPNTEHPTPDNHPGKPVTPQDDSGGVGGPPPKPPKPV